MKEGKWGRSRVDRRGGMELHAVCTRNKVALRTSAGHCGRFYEQSTVVPLSLVRSRIQEEGKEGRYTLLAGKCH